MPRLFLFCASPPRFIPTIGAHPAYKGSGDKEDPDRSGACFKPGDPGCVPPYLSPGPRRCQRCVAPAPHSLRATPVHACFAARPAWAVFVHLACQAMIGRVCHLLRYDCLLFILDCLLFILSLKPSKIRAQLLLLLQQLHGLHLRLARSQGQGAAAPAWAPRPRRREKAAAFSNRKTTAGYTCRVLSLTARCPTHPHFITGKLLPAVGNRPSFWIQHSTFKTYSSCTREEMARQSSPFRALACRGTHVNICVNLIVHLYRRIECIPGK